MEEREKKAWEGPRRRRGFLHMCITNIRQKNLSTNKGLQSNIHESTGQWQHGEGGSGWEDERGGEIELERQRSLRAMDLGEGFVSQSGSLDRFPSIHNALTAKNASCVTSSFS